MTAIIDDTYAEAFKSIHAEILITAINKKWLNHAVNAATGNASSSILCDCEAGLDRYVGPGGDESFSLSIIIILLLSVVAIYSSILRAFSFSDDIF